MLYDVTVLYVETDHGDGFRESGFSKERRLEPQITLGLLTDATSTRCRSPRSRATRPRPRPCSPVIEAFKTTHGLEDVTVVADAGMISARNQQALDDARLSFVLGARIPELPSQVKKWHPGRPCEPVPDGLILTQPWPAAQVEKAHGQRDRVIQYLFCADRARRSPRGADE